MTKKEIASKYKLTVQGLNKWKTTRPELYALIMSSNTQSCLNEVEKDLVEYFNQLADEEKEMYLSEMKAKAMRKKLGS